MKKLVSLLVLWLSFAAVRAQCPEQIVVDGVTYIKVNTADELAMLSNDPTIEFSRVDDGTGRDMYIFKAKGRFAAKTRRDGSIKRPCAKGGRGCCRVGAIIYSDESVETFPTTSDDPAYFASEPGDVVYYAPATGDIILINCGQ